jgi:hypothetical protein
MMKRATTLLLVGVLVVCLRAAPALPPSFVADLYGRTLAHLYILLRQPDQKLSDGADREAYFLFFDYWLVTHQLKIHEPTPLGVERLFFVRIYPLIEHKTSWEELARTWLDQISSPDGTLDSLKAGFSFQGLPGLAASPVKTRAEVENLVHDFARFLKEGISQVKKERAAK